jgi:hypothetical protein
LKRRQGVEGKARSWREDKELKEKQEVEGEDKEMKEKEEVEEKTRDEWKTRRSREERPSQEDESVRPHDLEIIHPTSQTKPKEYP